jgi:primosomal protein N' (replication factor Y) (superfamily II helicase)
MSAALLVLVALPVPLFTAFSYDLPSAFASLAQPGRLVVCPFRSKRLLGVITEVRSVEASDAAIRRKKVIRVLSEPSLPEDLFLFLRELAGYYLAPIGEAMRLALPPTERWTETLLEEPTLFPTTAGIAQRKIAFVVPCTVGASGASTVQALTKVQAALLARVRGLGGAPLAALTQTFSSARTVAARLAELGLVQIEQREKAADPFFSEAVAKDTAPTLTQDQAHAVARATDILTRVASGEQRTGATMLLRGVTGSGKTEVYLRAIADARAKGLGVIVLVPEIALTPQLVQRFRARFGDDVAVLHSALTPKERLLMWKRLRAGELDVVIGARSALFAPVLRLGLLIVDEEHDPSFKQEEGVRYQARDMAILRAHRASALVLLGSATPSLEAIHLTREGKAELCVLSTRARAQALPKVELVDLRRTGAGPSGDKRISLPLHRAIEQTLAKNEQAILFLNRRGFAPSARCEGCGVLAECPYCAVSLTFHKRDGAVLRCHYCDYQMPMLTQCKACASTDIALEGVGTEKLEETLAQLFPAAKIARLDRDVGSGKAAHRILERMQRREIDILVGTQMVAKGHDLPQVTLVGVINADAALSIPDFRASERGFHLMVQVAGRAGRGDLGGRVLIQTYDTKHPAVVAAQTHDVLSFTELELRARKELGYPPFSRLALVRIDALDESKALASAHRLAAVARQTQGLEVMGPAPAPIVRLRNRFRFRILLRSPSRTDLRKGARAILAAGLTIPSGVSVVVDIDPASFL